MMKSASNKKHAAHLAESVFVYLYWSSVIYSAAADAAVDALNLMSMIPYRWMFEQ